MRGSLVVGVALALVGCPREPAPGATGSGEATGSSSSTSSSGDTPTGGEVGAGTSSGASTTSGALTTTSTSTAWTTTTAAAASEGGSSSGEVGESGETSGGEGGDSTTGPPPHLFDCYGCDCDADQYYCQQVFNGVAAGAPRGRDRLCPVVRPDTLDNGCVPIPADCEGLASCTCLPQMNGMCFCSEVEAGVFEVVCPLP